MIPRGVWDWLYETPADCILILVFGTVWFMLYYAQQYRRWGTGSVGSWIFGFSFFLKIIVMYPFARSPENYVSVVSWLPAIIEHLDDALRISAGGVVAMVLGMFVASTRCRVTTYPLMDRLHDLLLRGWCHGLGAFVSVVLAFGFTALLWALGFSPLIARSMVFQEPSLRPIFNLWYEIVPFTSLCVTTYGLRRRSTPMVLFGLSTCLIGAAAGDRTMVVLTLVQCWIAWAMPIRYRRILVPMIGAAALVAAALLLASFRDDGSHGSSADVGGLTDLLYGNNLSDLRDFAWILSGLYGGYYMGMTYLAGYLSFIPTTMWDFRYEMAFGRVSSLLAGLDPSRHGGLRPPLFGELYVNFAWPGVIIGSAVFGYAFGRILEWTSQALEENPARARYSPYVAVWSAFLAYKVASSFIFTPSFFSVYVLGGLLAMGVAMTRVARVVVLPPIGRA